MRRVFRIPFGRRRVEREIDDELRFHIEARTERLISGGLSPDAARAEAVRQFGDLAGVRDSCAILDHERERSMSRASLLDEVRHDIRFAVRTLRRNAGFSTIVIGMLAVGIGANTAIFTLVDALLLRELAVSHPEQLIAIGDKARTGSMSVGSPRTDLISYPLYKDLRDRNHTVSGLVASGRSGRMELIASARGTQPERPRARYVS